MKLHTISINNLKRRKSKMAFLTIGLMVGIATIVTLVTLTRSMSGDIERKMEEFGANILITKGGVCKLADFGVATKLEAGVKRWLQDKDFLEDFHRELNTWVGRPTPLTFAPSALEYANWRLPLTMTGVLPATAPPPLVKVLWTSWQDAHSSLTP